MIYIKIDSTSSDFFLKRKEGKTTGNNHFEEMSSCKQDIFFNAMR